MKQELNLNSTEFEQLRATFKELVLSIQLATRKEQGAKIQVLQKFFKIEENLVAYDKRGKHWEEKASQIREKMQATWAKKKAQKNLKVTYSDSDSVLMSLEEAAKEFGMRPSSLRTYLTKGNGLWQTKAWVGNSISIVSVVRVDEAGNELRAARNEQRTDYLSEPGKY